MTWERASLASRTCGWFLVRLNKLDESPARVCERLMGGDAEQLGWRDWLKGKRGTRKFCQINQCKKKKKKGLTVRLKEDELELVQSWRRLSSDIHPRGGRGRSRLEYFSCSRSPTSLMASSALKKKEIRKTGKGRLILITTQRDCICSSQM